MRSTAGGWDRKNKGRGLEGLVQVSAGLSVRSRSRSRRQEGACGRRRGVGVGVSTFESCGARKEVGRKGAMLVKIK